jgi:IS5 family transposase
MRGSDDFFHSRIDHMIDLRHPLKVLASHTPWQEIEASLAKQLARSGACSSIDRPLNRSSVI